MSSKRYLEGQWRPRVWTKGADSNFRTIEYNMNQPYNQVYQLSMGTIMLPQPEPVFKQHTVTVDLNKGGILTSVAWPGANMVASVAGVPSPTGGLHGLFEAPLPGQQVVLGFLDGRAADPIVVQKYPYNASKNPIMEAAYFLPMTTKLHGLTDVVLGHHTGSYLAFRGTLPIPGAVELEALTTMDLTSFATLNLSTLGTMSISSIFSMTLESALVTIQNLLGTFKIAIGLLGIDIEAPGGTITLKTGDAAGWRPNTLVTDPFTGLPHSVITLLKGG